MENMAACSSVGTVKQNTATIPTLTSMIKLAVQLETIALSNARRTNGS